MVTESEALPSCELSVSGTISSIRDELTGDASESADHPLQSGSIKQETLITTNVTSTVDASNYGESEHAGTSSGISDVGFSCEQRGEFPPTISKG